MRAGLLTILLFAASWAQSPGGGTRRAELFGAGRDFYPLGELGVRGVAGEGGFTIRDLPAGGLGEFSNLQVGDLIQSADGETLSRDAWREMGRIMERVQGRAEPCQLKLAVLRDGEELTVTATLPRRLPHADTCPFDCQGCRELGGLALDRLADVQRADGAFPAGLGSTNGHSVVTSMTLLALVAAGETGKGGARDRMVKNALAYLNHQAGDDPLDRRARKVRPGENWNQTNWAWSFTGLAAGLLWSAREDRDCRTLSRKAARALVKNQEPSGGWGHGPGGKNALGYNELWVVSGLSMTALGLAGRLGGRVPERTSIGAQGYLEKSVLPGGGVGYGPGTLLEQTPDLGRTAVAILALHAADRSDDEACTALESWFVLHLDQIDRAHQGYLLQLALTGLAARQIGKETYQEFWKLYRHRIFLAHCGARPGSFTTTPTPESLAQRLSNDMALGEAWATAVHSLLLHLGLERFPGFDAPTRK